MGVIRVLPDQLVNQIAAGEVIERPASVVKELLENAIDAKATHVTVEILKGGTEKIVITDDGVGMDEMDARLAFERHATSKIAQLDDLFRVKSLGFRGEALASIASVSHVKLQTKTADALSGIELTMEGGKNPDVKPIGFSGGTKIEISKLFFNTPARKKYLKTEATEYRHVLEVIQDAALAHPEVAIKFVSNGRSLFDLSKSKKVTTRIAGLFGRSVSEEMLETFYGGKAIQISGHVGKPHTARTTRKYQYFIVNGRAVTDQRLSYAVKQAYGDTIPRAQYPIFVLFLNVDPELVDVNVHPRKLEVRFSNPQEMFRIVKSTVHAAVDQATMKIGHVTPNISVKPKHFETPAFMRKKEFETSENSKPVIRESGEKYDPTVLFPTQSVTPPSSGFRFSSNPTPSSSDLDARKAYLLKKRAERLAAQNEATPSPSSNLSGPVSSIFSNPTASSFSDFNQDFSTDRTHSGLQALAQAGNKYIVAEDAEGIVIVDQHAAHERVMLEKFRQNESERSPQKQSLLTPLQLQLNHREQAILEEHGEILQAVGFELEPFGHGTYNLTAIPAFLSNDDLESLIRQFLDELIEGDMPREVSRRHDHILHTMACKAATKFGKRLSLTEQRALLQSLDGLEGSSSCAHGRPTMMRLTFNELEQKFGRKG